MNKPENKTQENETPSFTLNGVISQDKAMGLFLENFVHIRATLEAIAQLQIQAVALQANLPESDVTEMFNTSQRDLFLVYAQEFQTRIDELTSLDSDA